jgi:hypothetical protein
MNDQQRMALIRAGELAVELHQFFQGRNIDGNSAYQAMLVGIATMARAKQWKTEKVLRDVARCIQILDDELNARIIKGIN